MQASTNKAEARKRAGHINAARRPNPRQAPKPVPATEEPASTLAAAARTIADLPHGYVADGFEVVGDQVRIYGRVTPLTPVMYPPLSAGAVVDAEVEPSKAQGVVGALAGADVSFPPAPAPVSRHSPLAQAFDMQRTALDDVVYALEELEMAASLILVPVPPMGEKAANGAAGETAAQSTALDILQAHQRRLIAIAGRVRQLADRMQS